MKIWLDDERKAPEGWIHIKTPWEAIKLLKTNSVKEISLDNYLGLDAYVEPNQGIHVAQFIEKSANEGSLGPLLVHIHTRCPNARKIMRTCLENAEKAWISQQ